MAAISWAAPGAIVNGEEVGPCVEPCEHRDCALTRADALKPCKDCGDPIGYERLFYIKDDGEIHATCLTG